jgi:hypothetical protein
MRPSAIKSSGATDGLRVWKESSKPLVEEGSIRAIINVHIASGHSWQPLCLCSSGQQGMSAGIADIPVISATGGCFALAEITSGCETSPTITQIARMWRMNWPKFIALHLTGSVIWEGFALHMFANDGFPYPESFEMIKLI